MGVFINTIWDSANAIATENIKTWDLFNTLINENNILKISLNSNITLSLYANEFIKEGSIVSGHFDEDGNLDYITNANITSSMHSNIIGIAVENIYEGSYGRVLVIGKFDNFYLTPYSVTLLNSNVPNYSQLFLDENGNVISIDLIVDRVLNNDIFYFTPIGLKLNKNELFFYPLDKMPVSSFVQPQIQQQQAFVDENISKGDLIAIDRSYDIPRVKRAYLPDDFILLGISTDDFTSGQQTTITYIERGVIHQDDPYFPTTLGDGLIHPTITGIKNVYLQSQNIQGIQCDSTFSSDKIINLGWFDIVDNKFVFYFNPYNVSIDRTTLVRKNINLSFPERNIMAGDRLSLYDFFIKEGQTFYLIEGQLGTLDENKNPILNENVYATIQVFKENRDINNNIVYDLIITEHLYKYKEFHYNNSVNGRARILVTLNNNSTMNKVFCNGYLNALIVDN